MLVLLQAAPLLLLLGLLVSGRAGPIPAVLAALLATVPAVIASTNAPLLPFLGAEALRGAWLALSPVGVVVGGLLFHAAVSGPVAAAPGGAEPRRIFAATLLMGVFMESVTGFGVGAVFALSALRGMGLRGAPAGAMAMLALVLVPWGGLGPGTALGAALSGLPAQELARFAAWPNAAWLLLMGPVLWRLCAAAGIAVPAAERLAQIGLLAAMAAILLLSHALFPFEVAGILASGLPLLAVLWRLDPPRGVAGWRRAGRSMAPYLGLTLALLLARGWPDPPHLAPYADLPGLPMTHVAVVLWLMAGALLQRRADGAARAVAALRKAVRPALAMLLYVVLARWMAGAGIASGLALAAADALGGLAPYAVPVLGLASGLVTGSNVGSNAALMPVQQALGQAAGLPAILAPGLHVFAGAAGAGLSFASTALVCGLLADGTRPAQLWRCSWPSIAGVLVLGWVIVAPG